MGVNKIKKRPAVFLDRDGTIIKQVEFLHKPSQVKLFPETVKALKAFNALGYLVVIITNQPVVAHGIVGVREVARIHKGLAEHLKRQGAIIDAIYFCPHHPEATIKKYRIDCACRKPKPGMILRAAKDHSIDLKKSFFIGDSTRDILAANRAKVPMILLKTGHGGKDVWQYPGKADFKAKDLTQATAIVKRYTLKTS